MYGLLVDQDKLVSSWTYKTYNVFPQWVDKAFGIIDEGGQLIGGILFQNFNGVNVELSYYGPHTLSSGIVRFIARCAVGHFDASRLTVVTSQKNKRLIRGLLKIGFKLEGVQRCFYGHKDCKKNTGVRLAAFRDALNKVAYKVEPDKKNAL